MLMLIRPRNHMLVILSNLNTSHVNVNLITRTVRLENLYYLNTSHVNVNHNYGTMGVY